MKIMKKHKKSHHQHPLPQPVTPPTQNQTLHPFSSIRFGFNVIGQHDYDHMMAISLVTQFLYVD